MILYQYPYTDFHELNLDYILKLCRETLGLHLEVVDNKLQLKNELGEIISNITISYATEAGHADSADEATTAQNAQHATTADSATTATTAQSATTADNATTAAHATTADSATEATHATNADQATRATLATSATEATHATNADYATSAGSATTAQSATSAATAATATEATHATNADNATLATRATNAVNDENGNRLISNYISRVVADNSGILTFYAKDGSVLATITPVAQSATEDSEGNVISTAVYDIIQNAQSDYLIIEHGDGTSETITINYAEKAWKDTANNIIKNVYFKRVAIVYDSQTSEPWLVFYNGENSEVARVQVVAQSAQTAIGDGDGDDIRSTYGVGLRTSGRNIQLYSKDFTTLSAVQAPYAIEAGSADQATYADQADYATAADTATKALQDGDGDVITTTYGAGFDIGDIMGAPALALTDKAGNILAQIVVPYAEQAVKDSGNNTITSTYVSTIVVTRGTYGVVTQIDFNAPDGTTILSLGNIKVDEAIKAAQDTYGNNFRNAYAAKLEISGTDLLLKSIAGNTLSTITVPYATSANSAIAAGSATNATNDASGNNIEANYGASLEVDNSANLILKSKDGTVLTTLASPLHLKVDEAVESLRATTDSDQNVIATTYIASLAYSNGVLTAYDSRGNILQTINIP